MLKSAGSNNRNGRAGGDRSGRPFEAARMPDQTDSARETDPAGERRYWLVPVNLDVPQGDIERMQWGSPRSE